MKEISDFENWLGTFMNYESLPDKKMFKLDTMRSLAELFGHPELACPCVHVAGSKGKGSVSKMVASILDAYAKTADKTAEVGVYASPHVADFRERMCSAQGFFKDEVYQKSISELTEKLDALRNDNPPDFVRRSTWFELVTTFAFLCFRNAKTKYAVYEVGMGGRLDATNIIKPEICCITSIELEHTEILGDTLEKIASEKAGIIKSSTPVIVASQPDSVKAVFRAKAEQEKAPIYFVDELTNISKVSYKNGRMHIKIDSEFFARPLNLKLQLLGEVQAKNAAEAALAAKILLPELDESIIEEGLNNAVMPGRFEIRQNPQPLILDGAHTPESIRQTLQTLDQLYPNQKVNLLFGLAAGKDAERIVPQFKNRFNKIFLTRPGDFKKSNLEELEEVFAVENFDFTSDSDFKQLIPQALAASKTDGALLLVTGSFYLIDEVIKRL